jgi:hypothetical protein
MLELLLSHIEKIEKRERLKILLFITEVLKMKLALYIAK